jgi:hypothetical protein
VPGGIDLGTVFTPSTDDGTAATGVSFVVSSVAPITGALGSENVTAVTTPLFP